MIERKGRQRRRPYFFRANHDSVTVLSMTCRSILLHCGQANVRKSWLDVLGSIAVNLIGEPQAMHCGPWFCVSSMRCPSVRRSEFSVKPSGSLRFEGIRSNDSCLNVIAFGAFEQPLFETNGTR
jgi:hypothetical protein